jgi:hypothetical protein
MPDRMNNRAVLLFMLASPGTMLFSAAISSAHPTSTREPTPIMKRLILFDKDLKEEWELPPIISGLLILFMVCSSNLIKSKAEADLALAFQ